VAWLGLSIFAEGVARLFHAKDEAHDLIVFFCRWLSPFFVFMGALFVSNAAFNTLGRPHFSTILNWGRATIGTVPFVLIGGHYFQALGVLAGNMAGGIAFGLIATISGYQLIARIGKSFR